MTHSAWWLTCDALAVYRLSVLMVRDTITAPLRDWLGRPWTIKAEGGGYMIRPGTGFRYWLWQLCLCIWCVSVWFAFAAMLLTRFWPEGWQYPAYGLALAAVAGFLGDR